MSGRLVTFTGTLRLARLVLRRDRVRLPLWLLGMTAVRYPESLGPAEMREVNQKLRKAIENEGRLTRLEGDWWQHSLTVRSEREPSAISLLRISRDREGGLEVAGRGWQEDGTLSSRYWSVASKEHRDPPTVFYYYNGERPRHPNAPQLEGTGEIRLDDVDRASGYWITRSDADPALRERTSGVYLRADPDDMRILDGSDAAARAELLRKRLQEWMAIVNT